MQGTGLSVSQAKGVLANDHDHDVGPNPLTAILNTTVKHGILSLNSDGSFYYISNFNFTGQDSFTYYATDGEFNSSISNVTIDVTTPAKYCIHIPDPISPSNNNYLYHNNLISRSNNPLVYDENNNIWDNITLDVFGGNYWSNFNEPSEGAYDSDNNSIFDDSRRKIQHGEVHIVIGPRSAIFAPLRNIGLIVVDEEQESSYKQSDLNPRYHARDVALIRGKKNQSIVILGSATPSIESYYNARTRKFKMLDMPRRVHDLPLPKVEIVDMREEWKKYKGKPSTIFSRNLMEKISEKLSFHEQVILLQNRRGFSTFILCKDCGHIERCINCNITLTISLRCPIR